MSQFLEKILEDKKNEVEELKGKLVQLKKPAGSEPHHHHSFKQALKAPGLAIIAEIKRKSPSKGILSKIEDPIELAHKYSRAGASAISVLTDNKYFGGSKEDLKNVVESLKALHPCPVLRKDFIIDTCQIDESFSLGAKAILLIVAVLGEKTKEFLNYTEKLGLDALVEIHDESELDIALEAKAGIVGVNNRNLNTFEVDLKTSETLKKKIPSHIITIAESGIERVDQAHYLRDLGYDAILVGEMLVKAEDPVELISQMGNSV